MKFQLQQLRVFCALIETGGFTRAAKSLRVSQPAVSKTIRDLENFTELSLLERDGRSVRMTEAGETLYAYARAMFELERSASEELRAQKGLECGTLRLGASSTVATYWLPPLLGAFGQKFPGLDLHLSSANTHDIAQQTLDFSLDVALVEGPVNHPKLRSSVWQKDELVLVTAPANPLARQPSLSKKDLQGIGLVTREEGSGTREVIVEALQNAGIRWRALLEIDSTEAIKQIVAAGFGAAFVSRVAAQDQCALGKLKILKVKGLEIHRALFCLTVVDRPTNAAARRFSALLEHTDFHHLEGPTPSSELAAP